MCVCMYVCVAHTHVHTSACPWRPEESAESPRVGVRSLWEPNSGPLEKQQVYLTIEPSLQPKIHIYFFCYWIILSWKQFSVDCSCCCKTPTGKNDTSHFYYKWRYMFLEKSTPHPTSSLQPTLMPPSPHPHPNHTPEFVYISGLQKYFHLNYLVQGLALQNNKQNESLLWILR